VNRNDTGVVESAPDVYQDAMSLYEVLLESDANIHATLDTDDDQVLLNQAKQSIHTPQSMFTASRLSAAVDTHRRVMQHHILRQHTSRARVDKADLAMHQRARSRLLHTHTDSFQSRINRQLAQHTLDNAPWYLRFDAPIAFGVQTFSHLCISCCLLK
jgi:recombination DNA repair RAD52 pathway protein